MLILNISTASNGTTDVQLMWAQEVQRSRHSLGSYPWINSLRNIK